MRVLEISHFVTCHQSAQHFTHKKISAREHLWTLLSVVEVVKPGHGVPPAKDRRVDGVDPLRLSTLALLVITRGRLHQTQQRERLWLGLGLGLALG